MCLSAWNFIDIITISYVYCWLGHGNSAWSIFITFCWTIIVWGHDRINKLKYGKRECLFQIVRPPLHVFAAWTVDKANNCHFLYKVDHFSLYVALRLVYKNHVYFIKPLSESCYNFICFLVYRGKSWLDSYLRSIKEPTHIFTPSSLK